MVNQNFSNSQFGLFRKWFWIGIVMALANVILGLIYGIALVIEKDRRKEGGIIIAFAIIWFVFVAALLYPWLIKSGVLPRFQLLQLR